MPRSSSKLTAASLRSLSTTGPVSRSRWAGKGSSRATQSVVSFRTAPSTRTTRKKRVRPRRAPGSRGSSMSSVGSSLGFHARLPSSPGSWLQYGNLPVQAAVQTVLVNGRVQLSLNTSTADETCLVFYPGANDTYGWYVRGTSNTALPDNTTIGGGYSKLTASLLTGLVSGTPKIVPEWRPTRMWVRVMNQSTFTSKTGGFYSCRPKGAWSDFAPGTVGGAGAVSAANVAVLPETRYINATQTSEQDFAIATFPTDLEAYAFQNTRPPGADWLYNVQLYGQHWAPIVLLFPPTSVAQSYAVEIFYSFDCKITEAVAGLSPLATLTSPPPVAAPHTHLAQASSILNSGSTNMAHLMEMASASVAGVGALLAGGARVVSAIRQARAMAGLAPLMVPLLA